MRGLLSVSDLLKPWKFAWPAFQLWSHKIMRWMVPLFLIAIFAANLALIDFRFYRFTLAVQLFFYAAALLEHASSAASPMEASGHSAFFLYAQRRGAGEHVGDMPRAQICDLANGEGP